MQLRDYARVLWKRGWIVILLAAAAALSAAVFSKLQTPIYTSTAKLSAVPSRPADWGQTQAIKSLLRLYVQQMQSPKLTQPVIDKLQLDVTPAKFVSQLNFSADEADMVILVEARHPDSATAAKMAQTLSETFVSFHNQENLQIDQQDRVLVSVLYDAAPPEIFSPKTRVNTLAGAILGGLIGLLVVFALEWLESDIVRTAEDVERYIGVTVLGSIPTISAEDAAAGGATARRNWLRATARARPATCPHCGNPI